MRALVLFDGQNLYRLAMRAYGPGPPYTWPSYDVVKLAEALVSRVPGRALAEVRFSILASPTSPKMPSGTSSGTTSLGPYSGKGSMYTGAD